MIAFASIVSYFALCKAIFEFFKHIEGMCNKNELDRFYVLLTSKKFDSNSSIFYASILTFYDKIFGVGSKYGSFTTVKFNRVVIFNLIFQAPIFCFSAFGGGLLYAILKVETWWGFGLFYYLVLFALYIYFSFSLSLIDFIQFSKTRSLMQLSAHNRKLSISNLCFIVDVISTFSIAIVLLGFFLALAYYVVFNGLITDDVIDQKIGGSHAVITYIAMNILSSATAIIINIVFYFSVMLSKIRSTLPSFINFLETYSSARQNPLQFLSYLLICALTPAYWFIYFVWWIAH